MTESMKRRLFAVVALLIAGGALGWISMGDLDENLVYYWSPTELADAGEKGQQATVRLGGMVVPGTYSWDQDAQTTTFDVSDGKNTVRVVNEGNPPQMFREGIGVVVEGQLDGAGVFRSDKLMVKHSNEYQAPEDGVSHENVYKSLVADEGTE